MEKLFDALNRRNIKDVAVAALNKIGYVEAAIELADTTRLTDAAIRRTEKLVKHRDEVNNETTEETHNDVQEKAPVYNDNSETDEIDETEVLEELIKNGKRKKAKKYLETIKHAISKEQVKKYKKQIKEIS